MLRPDPHTDFHTDFHTEGAARMTTEWHDDDAFWTTFAPLMFDEKRIADARPDIDGVLARSGAPAGCRVLDVCCGPGRHALELARRGFRVTGVDRSLSYLDQARGAAAAEGLDVEWVAADAREFRRAGAFDLALSLFTSFGYFADPEEDRRMMAHVRASLAPGGALVVDLLGKEVIARQFRPRDWYPLADGSLALEDRRVTQGWGWLENTWRIVRDGVVHEHRFGNRLYSGVELATLLRDVGFAAVELFGGLAGAPYDHEAERLVAVARV
jgi:SAM-dependent methyltransferase